ncbi:translation initiation factor 3 (bIF-3) [Citricoccus muralis]|uniref:Translation initiation factor IF-3 n=1 Tax=Citricoccus muralis TaxID=169134 RepID=A0A3D9LDC5_9MICC|nr:translation initiation factor IF-3 [Citricoccus muralis]REE03457.1 translation initiation factor 3 (bIF-3) [Citricoccus muralis]
MSPDRRREPHRDGGPASTASRNRSCKISEPRINERIRVPEVRLVGPQGEQVGIVRIEDALRLAAESDLDLVEVAPTAKPPVCKLMDFGKWKYEAAVKAREARKNQTNTILKEVRFRLKIDKHDYETKTGHARKFLTAGDKVKAMIQFRGREQQRPELGIRLLQKFAEDVADVGMVESSPRQDGRNMVMVIGPLKNKSEARAEARKHQEPKQDRVGSRRDVAAREAKEKVAGDTSSAPLSSTMSDAMPEELKKLAQAGSEAPVAEAPEAPVEKPADQQAAAPAQAAPADKPAEKPADQQAPAQAAPADKPAKAAPAAKPATVRPAAAKPAAAPKPAAAKPAAAPKPAAAKPAAKPAPAPKPAMPKPSAAPKPGAAPRPGPKPGGSK